MNAETLPLAQSSSMPASSVLRIPDIILKKRNGFELSKEEIDFFINSVSDFQSNSIQESQIGAMLMAIFFQGMNFEEAFLFTKAMMNSGSRFSWPKPKYTVVDKHSTGGVGDKISLPLAPALAACGVKVPMISGRGLGFTGGTLDKLESIPGFNVNLSASQIEHIIQNVGCCIVAQTSELNPADRILYANRDVTCTVDCIPLIAGSIVSKKAIEDLDALLLDVKVGKASFMKNQKDAELLADYMLQISRRLGFKAGVFLTRHNSPLGNTIGNQLEIEETIECLHGNLPSDLEELVTKYGGYLLEKVKLVDTLEEGAKLILEKLRNGEALEKFRDMCVEQGVCRELADELCLKKNYGLAFQTKAKFTNLIRANKTGYIKEINAIVLATVVSKLGAGRAKSSDVISYEVGCRLLKTVGEFVNFDEPWLQVYHNNKNFDELFGDSFVNSVEIVEQPVEPESLIIKIMNLV